MNWTAINRRGLFALSAAACGWALTGSAARVMAGERGPLWLSGYAGNDAEPRFGVAAFNAAGEVVFACPLPGRMHAAAAHPDGSHAVVMARRPGRWFALLDLARGRLIGESVALPDDRRGTGHGVFNADASLFFMAEDDSAKERGALALLDPKAGYARVGEIADVGVGPHEVLALEGGRTLAVADGGVLTHPDTGRVKLNLDAMDPALHYVDAASRRVVETARLPAEYNNLGIRHIAAGPKGAVFFGMQDERPSGGLQPLVGVHRRGDPPVLLDAPDEAWRRLAGYVGSLACDGRIIAASSPRGGVVATWNAETAAFIDLIDLPDGCGLGAAAEPAGGVIATNGFGRILDPDGATLAENPALRWDNHLSGPLFIG